MKIVPVILLITLTSCMTLKDWDLAKDGKPRPGNELKTEEEKKAEYSKYSLTQSGGYGNDLYLEFQKDAGASPRVYYSSSTYEPVLTQISPQTQEDLRGVDYWQTMSYCGLAVIFASVYLNSDTDARAQGWLMGAGFFTLYGGMIMRERSANSVRKNYNGDLYKYIFTSEVKKNQSKVKKQGLSLSYQLASF